LLTLEKIKRLSSFKRLKIEQTETLNQIITNGLVSPALRILKGGSISLRKLTKSKKNTFFVSK